MSAGLPRQYRGSETRAGRFALEVEYAAERDENMNDVNPSLIAALDAIEDTIYACMDAAGSPTYRLRYRLDIARGYATLNADAMEKADDERAAVMRGLANLLVMIQTDALAVDNALADVRTQVYAPRHPDSRAERQSTIGRLLARVAR